MAMNPDRIPRTRPAYRTLTSEARVRVEDRRSVFIGAAAPVNCEQEAAAFIARIRSEFPDASHHVYAWVLGGDVQLQRHTDDGEPQGTAGIPVLDVLRKRGLEDAVIVVTRYFGGVLLGAGGLIRAYGRAASQAVQAASPVVMEPHDCFRLTLPYADYETFRHRAAQRGWRTEEPVFGMDVDVAVAVPLGTGPELDALLAECTAGAGLLQQLAPRHIPIPLTPAEEDEETEDDTDAQPT